ncbi:MAG: hypothetical protein MUE85_25150 [Microscillaceae bacterium]|nr:hypothetical protein [Microscillaceae bacterium]
MAKLENLFVVPANTFDNVKGEFPIGFFIWNTQQKEKIERIEADVLDLNGNFIKNKFFYTYDNEKGKINEWLNHFKIPKNSENIGFLMADAPDFQNNNFVCLLNEKGTRHGIFLTISQNNLKESCIYLTVRHSIESSWLNDRDQFLYPNKGWEKDTKFQNDCLAFALFHGQNRITSNGGINHWIPFTEQEVNSREKFDSNFMTNFIKGKLKPTGNGTLLEAEKHRITALVFSAEAQAVFEAGKALWIYYHTQPKCNVNASLYDIREYFQGRNEAGKMNNKSQDETYNQLIGELRDSLKKLAKKIEPKVYEYGFLKA